MTSCVPNPVPEETEETGHLHFVFLGGLWIFCIYEVLDLDLQLLHFYDRLHRSASLSGADSHRGAEGAQVSSPIIFVALVISSPANMALHPWQGGTQGQTQRIG